MYLHFLQSLCRRRPYLPRLLALLLAPLAGCAAHFPRADEPMQFLERTTVGFSPGSDQLFDAEAAVHVFFANQLDEPQLQESGGFALASAFSFLGRVRMMDEPSTPVRTPSYEPRLRLQLLRLSPPRPAAGGLGRVLLGVELSAAHYSNGQKGCALADHLRGSGFSDFDCIPQTDPPATALNTLDGSFSTNYLGAGLRGKWMVFPGAGGPSRFTAAAALGTEWHLPCDFSGCMDPPMRARHGEVVGRWMVEGDVLVLRAFQRRIPVLGSVMADARLRATAQGRVHFPSASDPFGDVALEVAFVPRMRDGIGIGPFLRLHRGRDGLNIRFEEPLDVWTFGVVIDPAPSDVLDRGPLH